LKNVISTERLPIKVWATDLEDVALSQAKNLANLPFTYKHIALMSDAHMGYGMPIGGVMAAKYAIVPNAVGVDIGCGMLAVKTSIQHIEGTQLKSMMSQIRRSIPTGFNKHNFDTTLEFDLSEDLMPGVVNVSINSLFVVNRNWENAVKSLGTLGGGNHFIEIQLGSDGYIWFMVHSGSRNLGKQVADHYNRIAKNLNEKYYSSVPAKWDLAFLPENTKYADDYIEEMQFCIDYALANRRVMAERIKEAFPDGTEFAKEINIAHNYASLEHHFGENVWVHRKGATLAREGTIGIVPGSQGTNSYIVEGKGNPLSFNSCSHGAGRKMGRKAAERTLDLNSEINRLNDKGVIHSIRTKKDLDEAPGAYKDIVEVMDNQKDLVDIVTELMPLAVIKG
jgi:tRNA-splicing ligase RtcB